MQIRRDKKVPIFIDRMRHDVNVVDQFGSNRLDGFLVESDRVQHGTQHIGTNIVHKGVGVVMVLQRLLQHHNTGASLYLALGAIQRESGQSDRYQHAQSAKRDQYHSDRKREPPRLKSFTSVHAPRSIS